MTDVRISQEDPLGTVATTLIKELSLELSKIYPDSYGGDGSGAFKAQDVLVPRAVFVVAWIGDDAVGCGALRPMDDADTVEVKRMFVRPTERGRGISRLILAALEDVAREFGFRAVMLETGSRQPEAVRLYDTSPGYERVDCYGMYANEPLSICYKKILE